LSKNTSSKNEWEKNSLHGGCGFREEENGEQVRAWKIWEEKRRRASLDYLLMLDCLSGQTKRD